MSIIKPVAQCFVDLVSRSPLIKDLAIIPHPCPIGVRLRPGTGVALRQLSRRGLLRLMEHGMLDPLKLVLFRNLTVALSHLD